ncbi:MAG: SDR family oxidoreductase [Candidatus Heimdallarchaeota archaeon]|nr:SDR family oxidoreductase [Candidatus Heimdallarchaeota archaeon]MCK5142914.1 SDR family oxidoreductase [Candidatus Heimdallarchaeota archaeon]
MDLNLTNKHILLTGGTGGIGKAIIEQLVEEEARVTIHYNTNIVSATEIQKKYDSSNVFLVQGDLRKEKDIENLFSLANDHFGRIDSLIANAGIWGSESTLTSDLSLDQWNNTLEVNLTGVFLCVRAFFRNLIKYPGKSASIVLVGSTAGFFGEAGHADYSASKAALMYGLTKTWKNEIINYVEMGRVNSVGPGWVLTEMAMKSLEDMEEVRKILQTVPMQKIASTTDVANTVLFLLSAKASGHISGESLLVSGGMEGRVLFDKSHVDLSFFKKKNNG